jgi:hypothetical protein
MCTGMAEGMPPDPYMLVIFGASGDLARYSLIPSLYALNCRGLLPEPFAIIGFARRGWGLERRRSSREMRKHLSNLVWWTWPMHTIRSRLSGRGNALIGRRNIGCATYY